MKFTRDQYSLNPPSVHGWMKKDYCPALESALNFDRIQPIVEKYWKRNSYTRHIIDHDFYVFVEIICLVSEKMRKVMKVDMDNNINIGVYFSDEEQSRPHYLTHFAKFSLENAFLVPYLFGVVRDENDSMGLVFLHDERCKRVERLGLLESGFKQRTKM